MKIHRGILSLTFAILVIVGCGIDNTIGTEDNYTKGTSAAVFKILYIAT